MTPKYRNGREAKVGDIIVDTRGYGEALQRVVIGWSLDGKQLHIIPFCGIHRTTEAEESVLLDDVRKMTTIPA